MTERLQPQGSRRRPVRGRTPARARRVESEGTIPAIGRLELAADSGPTLFGLPAERTDGAEPSPGAPEPGGSPSAAGLVFLKRPDPVGACALVLAGVAANVSLSLSWAPGEGPSGLSLVQRGGETLDAGIAETARSGVWPPLVVVLCGGLLVLSGFLLLVPARTHRLVGVLTLAVALSAAAAVILLAADAGWAVERFGPGLWCAVAVPVLGVLGSLKAMLTAPVLTLDPR